MHLSGWIKSVKYEACTSKGVAEPWYGDPILSLFLYELLILIRGHLDNVLPVYDYFLKMDIGRLGYRSTIWDPRAHYPESDLRTVNRQNLNVFITPRHNPEIRVRPKSWPVKKNKSSATSDEMAWRRLWFWVVQAVTDAAAVKLITPLSWCFVTFIMPKNVSNKS